MGEQRHTNTIKSRWNIGDPMFSARKPFYNVTQKSLWNRFSVRHFIVYHMLLFMKMPLAWLNLCWDCKTFMVTTVVTMHINLLCGQYVLRYIQNDIITLSNTCAQCCIKYTSDHQSIQTCTEIGQLPHKISMEPRTQHVGRVSEHDVQKQSFNVKITNWNSIMISVPTE